MFKQGLFQYVPSIKSAKALIAALWVTGVLLVSIGLHSAEARTSADTTAPTPLASPLTEPTQPAFASPLPTPQPTPIVAAVSPRDGAVNVPPETPLTIDFRTRVDRRAIERGLAIVPQIDGKFVWDDRSVAFVPNGGWAPGVTYHISLRRGGQLSAPATTWSFSVAPFVRETTPGQNSTIDWNGAVAITFDEPMDRASVEAAFSIFPAIEGTFRWEEDTTLVFTPHDEWAAGMSYVVTLEPSLETAEGKQPLRSPFRLNFSTPVEQGPISFGYGPKVQVVNPDGRRAVQFEASGNLRPISVRLHALTIEQFLDRYTSMFRGVGPAEDKHVRVDDLPVVGEWRHAISSEGIDELILPSGLAGGLYVLTIEHPAARSDELIVVYTHDTLVLKQAEGHIATWASAIGGGPLADMRIRIYDRDATLMAEGQTDKQGLFVTTAPIDPQPLIVVGERDGEITVSGLSNEWEQSGWYGWWQPAPKANRTRAYIYTDRPIYRPGQTVHVKVVARYDNDAVYSRIPLEWDVIVRLRDARDNVVSAQTLHVNEYGTLNTSFDLAEGGTVGSYHVEAQIKDEVHRQAIKVEEYRKPEYEVVVRSDRGNLVQGEPVSVAVEVRTYFGAPVENARVDLATYVRAYDWYWYEGEDDAGGAWAPLESKLSGTTDAQGRWTGQLIPKVYNFSDYRHAVPMLIEATVNDSSGQAVSAHAQVTVHDAALGLTASLPRHAYQPGQVIPVSVYARDIDGRPRIDEPVTAAVLGWSNEGSYGGAYNRVLARAEGRTGQDGSVLLNLKVAQQGWYEMRITGRDGQGHSVTRTDWVWVYDPSSQSPWYTGDSGELQISADRSTYAPGDTAQLLIRTPLNGTALLTFERGRTRRAQVVELSAPTTIVPVTIQDDDAPNVYVAVNVYRPLNPHADPRWQSIPEGDLLVARTNLSVPADNRRLTVEVTPDRSVYGPREEATFTIQVTGSDGAPAQAELSFALVDESIYALSEELTTDPFEAFYAERSDIVRTYDSLRPIRWLGGGMGGGGGGGDVLGNPRWNFPDTAYWNPTIVTDANGRAMVKVQLPDSLTRWRAVVRVVTADEFPRVGQAVASITTTQPIVLRPALPRQLVQGDQFLMSAVVHNNTGQPREAEVWIEVEGLEIGTQMNTENTDQSAFIRVHTCPGGQCQGQRPEITRTVVISANGSVVVGWPASASALGTVTVTLRVQAGDAADAVRMALPVAPLAAPDVQSAVGEVETSVEEMVDLPPGAIDEASAIDIDLSPSIAASVLDGLAYLTGYPFGCVE
ncbi:MAG: MG2 domain-containing protein, partial [Anaerolineae bacterium]